MGDAIFPAPSEFTSAQISEDPILRYFHYGHLPMQLRGVSAAFCALAASVVESVPRNAERSVALRKLLEAKDAAVRANVPAAGASQAGSFYNRLLAESRELETRLEKLNTFMGTPDFLKLPEQQQALMQRQRVVMGDYAVILGNRIAHVNLNPHGQQQAGEEIDEGVRVTGGGHSEEPLPFRE